METGSWVYLWRTGLLWGLCQEQPTSLLFVQVHCWIASVLPPTVTVLVVALNLIIQDRGPICVPSCSSYLLSSSATEKILSYFLDEGDKGRTWSQLQHLLQRKGDMQLRQAVELLHQAQGNATVLGEGERYQLNLQLHNAIASSS